MEGIIINSLAVAAGGLLGLLFKRWVSSDLVEGLNLIFAICALGMGVNSVILMENMPPVILAVVLGTLIGLFIRLGDQFTNGVNWLCRPMNTRLNAKMEASGTASAQFTTQLVTVMVLFCSSGTGIYGSLDAGMTGNSTILLSKAILDFFTAMVFACRLGPVIAMIAIPQFAVFTSLFLAAGVIFPLTTPSMVSDFKACGGFLLIATGFRIAKIRDFPIADMLPAMVLAMPFSSIWSSYIAPLF